MIIGNDEIFGERAAIREYDGNMTRKVAEAMAAKDLNLPTTHGDEVIMETSENINELAMAMSKAQGQMKAAVKDKQNPFFKSLYADLASIFEVAREPLSLNGLAVMQGIATTGDEVVVTTMVTHSSGQWVKSSLGLRPTKNDPQGVASAATYGRRIGLQALIGVAADVDDDGNAASKAQPVLHQSPVTKMTTIGVAQREFNAWVQPLIESSKITITEVKAILAIHKNDYATALVALKSSMLMLDE